LVTGPSRKKYLVRSDARQNIFLRLARSGGIREPYCGPTPRGARFGPRSKAQKRRGRLGSPPLGFAQLEKETSNEAEHRRPMRGEFVRE
jgi:hypothetical protein